jgi:hypothetical protein
LIVGLKEFGSPCVLDTSKTSLHVNVQLEQILLGADHQVRVEDLLQDRSQESDFE